MSDISGFNNLNNLNEPDRSAEPDCFYDIIIIGAGPAGLTAAVYAGRAEKRVLIIEKNSVGGQITYSPRVENYPAIDSVSGVDLAQRMLSQATSYGVDIRYDAVTSVDASGRIKTVYTAGGETLRARALIIAVGVKHRTLGVDGEEGLIGNGISFCAVCDGAFYRGKTVAVVGGGNSALQEALLLSESVKKLYVIQNLENFTGEKSLRARLTKKDNVECFMGSVVSALHSDKGLLSAITVKSGGAERLLGVDGLFVAVGLEPENGIFESAASLDGMGYFKSGEDCLTESAGVFVAGDCRAKKVRQVTTACADGTAAAVAACEYTDRNIF